MMKRVGADEKRNWVEYVPEGNDLLSMARVGQDLATDLRAFRLALYKAGHHRKGGLADSAVEKVERIVRDLRWLLTTRV